MGADQSNNHIGIVGVSPEGASIFYRLLSRHAGRLRAPNDQPRVSLHNEPLYLYIEAIRNNDWHAVGKYLRRSAEHVARCGAAFCLTPDNAVQHGVQLAEVGSPIPWLTMPDLVGEAITQDKHRIVGILGTKLVMHSSTYQTHLGLRGIQVLAPNPDEAEFVDRLIFDELIYGYSRPESHAMLVHIVQGLQAQGCEAIVLASSELPLVLQEDSCPLPMYDSAEILAEAAVVRTTKAS